MSKHKETRTCTKLDDGARSEANVLYVLPRNQPRGGQTWRYIYRLYGPRLIHSILGALLMRQYERSMIVTFFDMILFAPFFLQGAPKFI